MKRVMIIAGEASGDMHAAQVVKVMHAKNSGLEFFGIAGPQMRAQGVEAIVKTETIAIMGFIEVLMNFKTIYHTYQKVKQALLQHKPDLLILVDYPGFNLKVAKLAKQCGIKVLYYISPQIWAWRQGRIKKIKQCVDMMAVVFPFELKFYEAHQVPVRYVGLPLFDELDFNLTQSQARTKLNLLPEVTTITLLPGSRSAVVTTLLPVMMDAVKLLKHQFSTLQFVLPIASTLSKEIFAAFIPAELNIKLIEGQSQLAIKASDAVISTSGTSTLETALFGVPLVVIYKMNALSFQIIKRLIKIKMIALCNIVAEKPIVKELIQHQLTAEAIAEEIKRILTDKVYNSQLRTELAAVRFKLDKHGAAENVATLALSMM
ncbi:MAG: lipid-A-disaccharide synthase [Gammaproteobacteria bacterium RIFCSPHIGHO2_12_FULL_35_23]|nr:MAG: lipid-A-disaccharide synthase [Gammaproteobacteria bacterium RIFCSPHIGHO2_12_FULL_35_23]